MGHIITLTGAAHCGKSEISKMFMDCAGKYFAPIRIEKYTTRKRRKNDEDVKCVDKIPKECDLVYEQYGVRYGLELEELYEYLEHGHTPIIVINDIRAVEDLKSVFGSLVISLFLYRRPAVYEEFYMEEKERASENITNEDIKRNARTRYEKAQAIYRIYIENIQLFDRVILNVFQLETTRIQVNHIVRSLEKESSGLESKES